MNNANDGKALSSSATRVQQALDARGLALEVVELPKSTRTAVEAAAAVGCEVGQIAKSLVFVTEDGGRPVLVIASGVNRVDVGKMSALAGAALRMATADEVRSLTGYAIGGVPPVGHLSELETWIDSDLMHYEQIWAAAGTPRAVFQVSPADLPDLTGGTVVQVA